MAIKIPVPYTNLSDANIDIAKQSKYFDENEYYNIMNNEGTDAANQYLNWSYAVGDIPEFNINLDDYNRLSGSDKTAYLAINSGAYDTTTKEYQDLSNYLNNMIQYQKDTEYYNSLSKFEKFINSSKVVLGNTLNESVLGTLEGLADAVLFVGGEAAVALGKISNEEAQNLVKYDLTGVGANREAIAEYANKSSYFRTGNKFWQITNDVLVGAGQQTVNLIPYVGPALYWTAMTGNTASSIAEEGSEHNLSAIKWFLATAGEMGTEWATEKVSDIIFGPSKLNALHGTASSGARATTNIFANIGLDFASEFFEESASEVIDWMIVRYLVNPDTESLTIKDVLYAGLIGGIIGAGATGTNYLFTKNGYLNKQTGEFLTKKAYDEKLVRGEISATDFTKLTKGQTINLSRDLGQLSQLNKKYGDVGAVANLMNKYSGETLDQIRENHQREYDSAVKSDAKASRELMSGITALTAIYNEIGDVEFTKALTNYSNALSEVQARAQQYLNNSVGMSKSDEALNAKIKLLGEIGVNAVEISEYTPALARAKSQLKSQYGIDLIVVNFGNEQGVTNYEVLDNNTILVDASVANNLSVDDLAKTIISRGLAELLQKSNGKFNIAKAQIVDRLLGSDRRDFTKTGRTQESIEKSQMLTLANAIMYDGQTIKNLFYTDKKAFSGVFKFFIDMKNDLDALKRKFTAKEKATYQQLALIANNYVNVVAKEIGNKLDADTATAAMQLNQFYGTKLINSYMPNYTNEHFIKLTTNYSENAQIADEITAMLLSNRMDNTNTNNLDYANMFNPGYFTEEFVNFINSGKETSDFKRNLNSYLMDNYGFVVNQNVGCIVSVNKISDELNIEFNKAINDIDIDRDLSKFTTLEDIFDPEFASKFGGKLRDVKITFDTTRMSPILAKYNVGKYSGYETRRLGGYNEETNSITIYLYGTTHTASQIADIKDTVMHEACHAIANIQGTSKGCSPISLASDLYLQSDDPLVQRLMNDVMVDSEDPALLADYIYNHCEGEEEANLNKTTLKDSPISGFYILGNKLKGYGDFDYFECTVTTTTSEQRATTRTNFVKYINDINPNLEGFSEEFKAGLNTTEKSKTVDLARMWEMINKNTVGTEDATNQLLQFLIPDNKNIRTIQDIENFKDAIISRELKSVSSKIEDKIQNTRDLARFIASRDLELNDKNIKTVIAHINETSRYKSEVSTNQQTETKDGSMETDVVDKNAVKPLYSQSLEDQYIAKEEGVANLKQQIQSQITQDLKTPEGFTTIANLTNPKSERNQALKSALSEAQYNDLMTKLSNYSTKQQYNRKIETIKNKLSNISLNTEEQQLFNTDTKDFGPSQYAKYVKQLQELADKYEIKTKKTQEKITKIETKVEKVVDTIKPVEQIKAPEPKVVKTVTANDVVRTYLSIATDVAESDIQLLDKNDTHLVNSNEAQDAIYNMFDSLFSSDNPDQAYLDLKRAIENDNSISNQVKNNILNKLVEWGATNTNNDITNAKNDLSIQGTSAGQALQSLSNTEARLGFVDLWQKEFKKKYPDAKEGLTISQQVYNDFESKLPDKYRGENLKREITKLDNQLAEIKQNKAELQRQLNEIEQAKRSLERSKENDRVKQELTKQLDEYKAQLKDLEAQNADLVADRHALVSSIDNAKENIASLEKQLDSARSYNDTLNQLYNKFVAEVGLKSKQISDLEQKIATLNERIKNNETELAGLEGEKARALKNRNIEYRKQIRELEAQLNKSKTDDLNKALDNQKTAILDNKEGLNEDLQLLQNIVDDLHSGDLNRQVNGILAMVDDSSFTDAQQAIIFSFFEQFKETGKQYKGKSTKEDEFVGFRKFREVMANIAETSRNIRIRAMLSSPVTGLRNYVNNTASQVLDFTSTLLEKGITDWMSSHGRWTPDSYRTAKNGKLVLENRQWKYTSRSGENTFKKIINQQYGDKIHSLMSGVDPRMSTEKYQRQAETMSYERNKQIAKNPKEYVREQTKKGKAVFEACLAAIDVYEGWLLEEGFLGDKRKVYATTVAKLADLIASNKATLLGDMQRRFDQIKNWSKTSENIRKEYNKLQLALQNPTDANIFNAISEDTMLEFTFEAFRLTNEVYFKSANWLSRSMQKLYTKNKLAYEMVSWVIPFSKVGANVLNMAINYSPVGLVKGFIQMSKLKEMVARPNSKAYDRFAQAKAVKSISQGTIGTTGLIIGALLGALGVLSFDEDDNLGTVIKVGNFKISLAELSPATTGISVGAAIASTMKSEDRSFKLVLERAFNQMYNNTTLSTIDSLFTYADSITEMGENTVINMFTQYVPAVVKLINKIVTKNAKKDKSGTFIQRIWKNVLAGIPGLSELVPNKIDPYTGEKVYGYGTSNGWISTVFALSPIDMRYKQFSDFEAEAIEVGATTSGLSGKFDINDKTYTLSGKTKEKYAKIRAKYANEEYNRIVSGQEKVTIKRNNKYVTTVYSKLTNEEKAKVLKNIYSDATSNTKIQYWLDNGHYYVTNNFDEYRNLKKIFSSTSIKYSPTKKTSKFVE